jgi:hypothetical protein
MRQPQIAEIVAVTCLAIFAACLLVMLAACVTISIRTIYRIFRRR